VKKATPSGMGKNIASSASETGSQSVEVNICFILPVLRPPWIHSQCICFIRYYLPFL